MRGLCLVIPLAACHAVFDLETIVAPDAARPPDAAQGHDDDGDGIPDVLDLCPGIPGYNDVDTDGDGIGDVCDPAPGVANQRQGPFLELAGTDLTTWDLTNGTWSPEASAFVQTSISASDARVERPDDLGPPPWTIELALEPIGIGDVTSPARVLIYTDDLANPGAERYACGFRYANGTWNLLFGHPGSDTLTDVGVPLEVEHRYTLQLTVENNTSARCRVFDGVSWHDAPNGIGGTASTRLAVDVQAVAVRLYSIAIYDARPPP